MTRSEVKTCLFAWSAAARRLDAICKRLKHLEDELSTLPAPSVPAPAETASGAHGERVGVILPHGNQTSDPTARAAALREGISNEMERINRDAAIYTDFYFSVLRVLTSELTRDQALIVYGYYAAPYPNARAGFINATSYGKATFYRQLRAAITTLQYADSLPDIPDDLHKE